MNGSRTAHRVEVDGRRSWARKPATRIRLPGDKSISHRALLLAAITPGETRLRGVNGGRAVDVLIPALRSVGVRVDAPRPDVLRVVTPETAFPPNTPEPLHFGGSSTAARLMLGILAARGVRATLTGDASLRARPMHWVIDPLRKLGVDIEELGRPGHLPIRTRGGSVAHGHVRMEVISAQASSCILFAALAAGVNVAIDIPGPSRDHTERLLSSLGAEIRWDERSIRITRSHRACRYERHEIPGDPSGAAYFAAACVLSPKRVGPVTFEHILLNPRRLGFFRFLEAAGAEVRYGAEGLVHGEPVGSIEVRRPARGLRPVSITSIDEVHACIDEIPLCVAMDAVIGGRAVFENLDELRFKESDRIETTARMLRGFGVDVSVSARSITLDSHPAPRAARGIDAAKDHRVVMSAITMANCLEGRSSILGAECLDESVPGFLSIGRRLGFDWQLVPERLPEMQKETTR